MRLRRFLFRVPLQLHHRGVRGLERLIGIDWIVLETRGRRSGRPHEVMLDVVHEADDTVYVQPADGRHADWVRNVTADPHVTAELRGERFAARVDDVTGAEGAEAVLRFVRGHPWYARVIVWFVGYVDHLDRPDDELRAILSETPVFAIRRRPA
jgi:deazaflavin-dependent oxidoreductase (nitroreductase family)